LSFFNNRKRITLAAMLLGGVALIAVIALVVSGSGGSSKGEPQAQSRLTKTLPDGPDVAPSPTPIVESAASAEEPLPSVAEPNRADCAAIRGTSYLSETERIWFRDNCSGSGGGATTTASAGSVSTTRASSSDRLTIPSIGLDSRITPSRVLASGEMPTPSGYYDVYWYDFSAISSALGGYVDGGNLVLAGHVTCAYCNNGQRGRVVFGGVPSLTAGAAIQYRDSSGQVTNYVVTSVMDVYPESNWDGIVAGNRADMTLITCNGVLDTEKLEYDQRRVVFARKV
jgi:sortase (surface protein transpeptidase)